MGMSGPLAKAPEGGGPEFIRRCFVFCSAPQPPTGDDDIPDRLLNSGVIHMYRRDIHDAI